MILNSMGTKLNNYANQDRYKHAKIVRSGIYTCNPTYIVEGARRYKTLPIQLNRNCTEGPTDNENSWNIEKGNFVDKK